MHNLYVYDVAGVEKITDGDTYWLRLDVGFRQQMLCHIRLNNWDTPELYRPQSDFEKEQAREAANVASMFIHDALSGGGLRVKTEKDPDSFGRWLGMLWSVSETKELGKYLGSLELATRWPTKWRDVYDT